MEEAGEDAWQRAYGSIVVFLFYLLESPQFAKGNADGVSQEISLRRRWDNIHLFRRMRYKSLRVASMALRFSLWEFLRVAPPEIERQKILAENLDVTKVPDFQRAA